MPTVDITNPVPPDWYVPVNVDVAVELVRNGNAVFWRIERTHPDRAYPGAPIEGAPVQVADYGLFAPGSGDTPKDAKLFGPPDGRAGLELPGIPQHTPGSAGYPVVTNGSVRFDGHQFRLSE